MYNLNDNQQIRALLDSAIADLVGCVHEM